MRLLRRREGGAVATYAAVLDGAHLWLDLPGPVSLRDTGTRDVTELGDHPYDLTGLTGLTGPTGSTYDVLVDTTPVELATDPALPLSRTPLAPDGVTQWDVVRLADGRVQLTRGTVPPTATLEAIDVRGDRVHLRLQPHGGVEPGCHLLLLDADDQVLATLPVTAHDGHVEALVGVDDLPAGYVGMLRPALGTDSAWVRIRRRANDLADPNHAVLLPELHVVPDQPRARFRWNPDGLLALRSIDPDEAPVSQG